VSRNGVPKHAGRTLDSTIEAQEAEEAEELGDDTVVRANLGVGAHSRGRVLEPQWDGFRFLFEHSSHGSMGCWTRPAKRHDGNLLYIEEPLAGRFPGHRRRRSSRACSADLARSSLLSGPG
jgi:hypothetical protein